jgi:prephenate dehydrogenase
MKIGIVGLGLIGGTYAKALNPYQYEIIGFDKNQNVIDYALETKMISKGTITPKQYLKECDIVFVCLYPKDTVNFIKNNINNFKRNAIVSDVTGIKRKLFNELDMYFNDDIDFVFAHPIAGSEKIGIKHSNKAIFQDANFVITPHKFNSEETLNLIETLAKQMGFKTITRITDVEHDKALAFTSQLTHAIAIALVNSDPQNIETNRFIGDSYKDLTRIAVINETLWTELFMDNKDFLVQNIDRFIDELTKIKKTLKDKNHSELKEIMIKARNIREKI